MHVFIKSVAVLFSVGVIVSCGKPSENQSGKNHAQWRVEREAALKKEDGWLNLAGLFWLKQGANTLGSKTSNDIVFPEGKAAAFLGTLEVSGDLVRVISPDSSIQIDGKPVTEQTVFPYQKPVEMRHKNLVWFIIKRGERLAVRLRDLDHPAVAAFTSIPTYAHSEAWILKARFEPAVDRTLSIKDVTGAVSEQKSPGNLHVEIEGKPYALEVLNNDENTFFVIFADATNSSETYAAGRYLYVDKPKGMDPFTLVDFNRAINPPCAFTDYATCPLPPESNRLSIAITAGEQRPAGH
jgi:uncharacterized protein (DUF1684 family)